jgi:hypothetical protein
VSTKVVLWSEIPAGIFSWRKKEKGRLLAPLPQLRIPAIADGLRFTEGIRRYKVAPKPAIRGSRYTARQAGPD